MAKRKSKMPPASAPARIGKPIHLWAPEELRAALEDYLQSLRPRPTLTSVVCVALEEYLRQHGYWPPASTQ